MRHRYLAILLGTVLSFSVFIGCGASESSTSSSDNGETIYGEVSKIDDSTITIKVGTQKEPGEKSPGESEEAASGKPVGESSGEASEKSKDGKGAGKERPSMLELTGEEKEITVSDDTVIKREGRGGFGGGEPKGDAPEKKNGGGSDSENSNGDSENSSSESGSSGSEEQQTERPDGEEPEAPDGEGPEAPEGGERPEAASEEISLEDIAEGDTISVTFDSDGKVETVTVIFGGGRMKDGDPEQVGWSDYEAEKVSGL